MNRYQGNEMTWFVADVQVKDASGFHVVTSEKKAHLSKLVQDTDAVLAINADNWGAHPNGVIIRDGKILRSVASTRHMLMLHQDGALTMHTDRKNDNPSQLANELIASDVVHTFEFGPALVENG